MGDYYKILGIKTHATVEEIKKAYFEKAKKYHPDSGDETEIKRFHKVAEAYRVLSDPNARKAYDTTIVDAEPVQEKVSEPAYQTVRSSRRDAYRDDELKTFHRNRFKKAVFRLIIFTMVLGLVGYGVSAVLEGIPFLGGVAGLFIGFGFSVNKNFNVRSFFTSDFAHKSFRFFTWLLLGIGFGYFVWLIVRDLIF